MKTPRDILFARHRAAESKLDAIREALVAGLRRENANPQSQSAGFVAQHPRIAHVWEDFLCVCKRRFFHLPPSILHPLWLQLRRAVYWWLRCSTHLWRELILPSRRIWAGLAAVWLLLLIINLSQRDPVSGVTGQPVHAPAVTMSWQLQQRWMDELLADRSPSPEADRPRTAPSRPRTEEHEIMAA